MLKQLLSNLQVFQIKLIDMLKVPLIDNLAHKIGIRYHNTHAECLTLGVALPIRSPRSRNADVQNKEGR